MALEVGGVLQKLSGSHPIVPGPLQSNLKMVSQSYEFCSQAALFQMLTTHLLGQALPCKNS